MRLLDAIVFFSDHENLFIIYQVLIDDIAGSTFLHTITSYSSFLLCSYLIFIQIKFRCLYFRAIIIFVVLIILFSFCKSM